MEMIVKNWFELIKRAGIAPTVVHDEEQYPAELVRLCELVAADAEAREAKLRDALEKLVRFNSSNEYTEVLSAYIANGREALSHPTDDTALHEMITKAGEVMRERCIGVSQDEMDEQFVDSNPWYSARSCRDSIRALPVVTLDDLKGGFGSTGK